MQPATPGTLTLTGAGRTLHDQTYLVLVLAAALQDTGANAQGLNPTANSPAKAGTGS